MRYEHDHLEHYGILGQKWGVRRFQNEDGTLTNAGKERYYKNMSKEKSKESSLDTNDKSDSSYSNTKRFLIGAGIVALTAVGVYAAIKIRNNKNSIANSGLPETWKSKNLLLDPQNKSGFVENTLLNDYEKNIKPRLTTKEKQAIGEYTYSDGAIDINYFLERDLDGNSEYRTKSGAKEMREHFERKQDREKWCSDQIDFIDSALDKTSTPIDIVVDRKTKFSNVRGMFGVSAKELEDILSNPQKAVGRKIHQKSYCSSSIDSTANTTFGHCNLHIYVPKGSKGMYVAPISSNSKEKEFLLPRNSNFIVREVRNFSRDPDTVYFSSVEIFLELMQ